MEPGRAPAFRTVDVVAGGKKNLLKWQGSAHGWLYPPRAFSNCTLISSPE
jgi:hypothetical protein